jgi:diguanylate cyclase (GGDEF)-like protein/PAS domain S-box-containing protein
MRFFGIVQDITERKKVDEALRISYENFSTIFYQAPLGIAVIDSHTGQLYELNFRFAEIAGRTVKEMTCTNWMSITHPDDIQEDLDNMALFNAGKIPGFTMDKRYMRPDGSAVWIKMTIAPLRSASYVSPRHLCMIDDITRRKMLEGKLQLAANVFAHASEGIMITDVCGNIIDVNTAFTRITSYSRAEVLGQNPRILSSGRHDNEFFAAMWCDFSVKGYWCGEVWNRRKNGEVYAVMQNVSALRDAEGGITQYVALLSDITTAKEHEMALDHIAHYDTLTALPNRALLADRLQQAMFRAERSVQPLAVVFLDLDGFKAINDKNGHNVGDQLLIALSSRMKQALREGDTLSRIGGDEFVAILLDLGSTKDGDPTLSRLLAAAAKPVHVGDLVLQVSASLGVTFYPQNEEIDGDQLLRQADQAMYRAKLAGKNRYHVFDATQDRIVRGLYESVERIRQALNDREFVLYYQPKVNMRTGNVIGAEALIRWQHPEKGLLLPGTFLPVIENHPLAIELGEWVIESALTQLGIWKAAGLSISVSVNIGARQLQEADFVERLRTLLSAHPDVQPCELSIEMLETSALQDLIRASDVIDQCRKFGVLFALDDFGTGYSSLTYLKHLPVSQLKIDQSFVRDMLDDPDDLSILEGVLGLAIAFHREVIAEGVETSEHGMMLLQLGCDLAQGYGIGRPMPASEFPACMDHWRTHPSWGNLPPVIHADLPLLFASAEHRAWVVSIESYVKGEREKPMPLDQHQCRFGKWLDSVSTARHEMQPAIHAIEPLHRQLHELAVDLCDLMAQGRNHDAQAKLGELQETRDHLLKLLSELVAH